MTETAPSPAPAAPKEKPLRRALRAIASSVSSRLLTLCWITYALGALWVLLHPAVTVTTGELKPRGTYMSENALLVDSIDAKAWHREETRAREWHKSFLAIPQLPPLGCGHTGDCARVVEWLETQLRSIDRVEAFRQRFLVAPNGNGTNVYGILKAAPLADHKESIVLVTHYLNIGAQATNAAYSGVALGLALLEFLADAKWLAKDVILVFADDGASDGVDGLAPGTDAWLRAYHLDPLSQSSESSLPMRAGLIRAAINLETIGDLSNVDVVGVFPAGINGQLPNLDLVNTVVSHTAQESVPVVLDRCLTVQQAPIDQNGFRAFVCDDTLEILKRSALRLVNDVVPEEHRSSARDYVSNLAGMLRFMKTLATGPSGLHGSFISYNIDAVTFAMTRSVEVQHWQGARSITSVLRSLELVVRSLSNLEEKLHQSFFLYVLPNNHDFVSVGEYYYTVALAVSPAIMHLILTCNRTAGMRVAFALATFLAIIAVSLITLQLLVRLPASAYPFLFAGLTGAQLFVVLLLVPRLRGLAPLSGSTRAREWIVNLQHFDSSTSSQKTTSANVADSPLEVDRNGWRALKCALLTLIVYAHCILGILNYPMALFCALPMAFFALVEPFAKLSHRPVKRILFSLWLVASSPFTAFTLMSALDSAGTTAALTYFVKSFLASINVLALPYFCCVYLPVHTLAMAVWVSPVHAVADESDGTMSKKQQ